MAEKETILELEYRITPEDFYAFSVRSMNRQYAARAKKTNVTAPSSWCWASWCWGM